VVDGVIMRGL